MHLYYIGITTRNLALGKIYMWDTIKEIFKSESIKIDLEEVDLLMKGRISINVENVTFETCLIPPPAKNIATQKYENLYVLLTALDSTLPYPQFTHQKWSTMLDGYCLYIDDPTRLEHGLRFHPCFFFGTKEKDYCLLIAQIVRKFSEIYKIANKNITLIGSSNAGFACIRIANLLKEANCIALCPQISISEYYLRSNKTIFEREFHLNLDDEDFRARTCLKDSLESLNSKVIIYSNIREGNYLDIDQMNLLHRWFEAPIELGYKKLSSKLSIILTNLDSPLPHLAQPGISFVKYLIEVLKGEQADINTINGFIEDLKILYSIQKNLYFSKINISWKGLLEPIISNLPAVIVPNININRNFQRFSIKNIKTNIYYELAYNKGDLFFSLNFNNCKIEQNKNIIRSIANDFGGKTSVTNDRVKIYRRLTIAKQWQHIDVLNSLLNTYEIVIANAEKLINQ